MNRRNAALLSLDNCHEQPMLAGGRRLGTRGHRHQANARAQGYGTDTQNVLTPAGGGMAGVSRPSRKTFRPPSSATRRLDPVPRDAIHHRRRLGRATRPSPTTASRWRPVQRYVAYPRVCQFRNRRYPRPSSLGLPGTFGDGFRRPQRPWRRVSRSGAARNFLNNVSNEYMVLGINMAVGFEVTDRLSVGAAMTLGTGFEQLGFIGPIVSRRWFTVSPAGNGRARLQTESAATRSACTISRGWISVPQCDPFHGSIRRNYLPRPQRRSAADVRARMGQPQPDGR